jgi:hypothetical protein
MTEASMGKQPTGTLLRWRPEFRMIVVVTWLLVVVVVWLFPRTMSKAAPIAVFWWFRVIAVLGFAYLLYEVGQATEKRVGVGGLILDAVLVLPMYLLWFAAWAAGF